MLQFLVGLRDEYEQARQQILLIEPLPNLEKAYSMVTQVEDQLILQNGRGDSEFRMAMQFGKQTVPRGQFTGNNQGSNTGIGQGGFKRRLTK